jgi:hypothetical protein
MKTRNGELIKSLILRAWYLLTILYFSNGSFVYKSKWTQYIAAIDSPAGRPLLTYLKL